MRLLAIILITLLFSCKASEETSSNNVIEKPPVEVPTTIAFKPIIHGQNSDYKKSQTIIITTQNDMDQAWMKMFGDYARKPPIPMVDFETKQLLLVTMGEQPNGGYSVKIKSMAKSPEGIVVAIEDIKPGKTCNVTSALTYPFDMVEMPKTEETIIYTRLTKMNSCD